MIPAIFSLPMQLVQILALLQVGAAYPTTAAIRINQLGYLSDAPKIAVFCALEKTELRTFVVTDSYGKTLLERPATPAKPFGSCVTNYRLDFSSLRRTGEYHIAAGGVSSPIVRIRDNAYAGAADTLLYYMREQRSGFNPLFHTVVHTRDGIVVDDSTRAGKFVPVTGGWADASDYLQYVMTSANATFVMLMAYRDHPRSFTDQFDSRGLAGSNGVPDVLDEARHGLEWLIRMFPSDSEMYNQLGDDRDHTYWDLPPSDSADYGWGKGKERPVYPCTGRPQGLFKYKNRSNGFASTAGKYASAFALAASIYKEKDPAFATNLRQRALSAYAIGKRFPGVCQGAPGRAPYYYEEDNWVDDMELAAAELYALTHNRSYLRDALDYASREPVTPWMGADTAKHYQWYPWHNNGHYEIWRAANGSDRKIVADYYKRGLTAVVARADNGFRIGIPFIWCSNNLMASFATQAYLYRRMTGDNQFREYEQAALDWLFGTNPWGTSMVIGLPHDGVFARDPHSVVAKEMHVELTGALLDGPVYSSIYKNLLGISLHDPDEYAPFNAGFIVYHDDVGDYSTNEPIMDGTANLSYVLAAMGDRHR
ncbi:MAG TPA: glycoside hydrolase family 9 protein [Gemmatimonadaceae bacterium]|nr:glycoside hydrolase family 9 protein [Gemmatimonadaceae bacterium]